STCSRPWARCVVSSNVGASARAARAHSAQKSANRAAAAKPGRADQLERIMSVPSHARMFLRARRAAGRIPRAGPAPATKPPGEAADGPGDAADPGRARPRPAGRAGEPAGVPGLDGRLPDPGRVREPERPPVHRLRLRAPRDADDAG